MIKIGFFRLESRVCILCWKFVWGHLHKTEVRQRKERSSSCDDECLVLKKKAVSQLVLLIRETDYTIFIVWAVPQTILQKPVCYFTTGWVSACCTFAMLLSDVWQLKEVISQHCEHHCRFFFFNLICNLKCVLLGLIEIIERELIHFILIWVSNYIVSTLDKSIKIQLNTWVIFKVFSSKWCENHCIEKEYLFVFTWKDSNC